MEAGVKTAAVVLVLVYLLGCLISYHMVTTSNSMQTPANRVSAAGVAVRTAGSWVAVVAAVAGQLGSL